MNTGVHRLIAKLSAKTVAELIDSLVSFLQVLSFFRAREKERQHTGSNKDFMFGRAHPQEPEIVGRVNLSDDSPGFGGEAVNLAGVVHRLSIVKS